MILESQLKVNFLVVFPRIRIFQNGLRRDATLLRACEQALHFANAFSSGGVICFGSAVKLIIAEIFTGFYLTQIGHRPDLGALESLAGGNCFPLPRVSDYKFTTSHPFIIYTLLQTHGARTIQSNASTQSRWFRWAKSAPRQTFMLVRHERKPFFLVGIGVSDGF